MIKYITQADLLLYFYQEASSEIAKTIEDNLVSHPQWQSYLDSLKSISTDCDQFEFSPNSTTCSIILEESRSYLEHSI